MARILVLGDAEAKTRLRQRLLRETTSAASRSCPSAYITLPEDCANFLNYVDGGFYDGGSVIRAVRPDNTRRKDVEIQVIQFQIDPARRKQQFPPIPLELTTATGLRHLDGTLSMTRGAPDTATGFFSIVIGNQPEMDVGGRRHDDGQGFAAFGRVLRGMDVVAAIHALPTGLMPSGQAGPFGPESLSPPIKILKAARKPAAVCAYVRAGYATSIGDRVSRSPLDGTADI